MVVGDGSDGDEVVRVLVQGGGAEERLRKELGEGEGSLKEEFRYLELRWAPFTPRNGSEPGCLVVCGAAQMLPLAKRYFYSSLNTVIRENETKHATSVLPSPPV